MEVPLTPAENARYLRQMRLPGFGGAAQRKLRDARVLVVGLGGLGSPASLYLAAAGVGTLGLADFDTVAEHNLHRQVVHGAGDVGRAKIASAAARLGGLNPQARLVPHPEGVTVANALALVSAYDVVVDGSDNFPTRYLVNDACVLARRPLVYGSIFQHEGQVSVFDTASGGPCYRCLFPEPPGPGEVPNCEEAGVLGALCGIVGSWQALQALYLLTGLGEPLRGRLLAIDGWGGGTRSLALKRDPACPVCGERPRLTALRPEHYPLACAPAEPPEVSPMTPPPDPAQPLPPEVSLADAQALRAAGALVVDVREPDELAIVRLDGALHLPMGDVPACWSELPKDRPLLILCHHGGRSARVTQFLRARGFANAANIRGGIDRWAAQLDPSLPRY